MSTKSLLIVDDFCPVIEEVKASAYASGFGKWAPNTGMIGSSQYDGMNFQGLHSRMVHSLAQVLGQAVFPNSMFFRVTNEETERAYTHSDRESGDFTCVCYLTEHDVKFGTGFYRHRKTGLTDMPPVAELAEERYADLRRDITEGGPEEWEETAIVMGHLNRAAIFRAPLFHRRIPNGVGNTVEEGRLIWGCHFFTSTGTL